MRFYDSPMPACPVCGSEDVTPHLSVTVAEAARQFASGARASAGELEPILRDTWGRDDAAVYLCGACELGFAVPQAAGTAEFYSRVYGGEPEYPSDRWEFRRTLAALEDLAGGRLLEIGAGSGRFLVQARATGRWDCAAVEYGAGAVAALERLGFETRSASLEELAGDPPWQAAQQVVCLFQTLEHLAHPHAVFDQLTRMLAPGGHLFVSVPNGAYIGLQEALTGILDLPPNHVTRWSERALAAMAGAHGLRVVALEREPAAQGEIAAHMAHSHRLANPLPRVARRLPPLLDSLELNLRARRLGWRRDLPSPTLWAHFAARQEA
ncbi:MAG: hypothetical protein QOG63_1799 [Thermoleophilaceae bacterium]|nr:hypothetical protein [Thermoleophilaceae bacterium]